MPTHKRHNVPLIVALATGDLVCLALAILMATHVTAWISGVAVRLPDDLISHLGYFIAFAIAWPVPASNNRLYISRRRDDLLSLIFDIVKSDALPPVCRAH